METPFSEPKLREAPKKDPANAGKEEKSPEKALNSPRK